MGHSLFPERKAVTIQSEQNLCKHSLVVMVFFNISKHIGHINSLWRLLGDTAISVLSVIASCGVLWSSYNDNSQVLFRPSCSADAILRLRTTTLSGNLSKCGYWSCIEVAECIDCKLSNAIEIDVVPQILTVLVQVKNIAHFHVTQQQAAAATTTYATVQGSDTEGSETKWLLLRSSFLHFRSKVYLSHVSVHTPWMVCMQSPFLRRSFSIITTFN